MDQRSIPIWISSAFTREDNNGFTGNPAAICFLEWDDDVEDTQKQAIATELNQPITIFVSNGWYRQSNKQNPSKSYWFVKWFSVNKEVGLCGHATFAAASAIFKKYPELTSVTFEGRLGQKLKSSLDLDSGLFSLTLPACPFLRLSPTEDAWVKELVLQTLGNGPELEAEEILYSAEGQKILLVLKYFPDADSETLLRSVSPNLEEMMNIVPKSYNLSGVGVTIKNNRAEIESPTFFSRFFAPWVEINEDEVCGSLHAMLTPYWMEKLGKSTVVNFVN